MNKEEENVQDLKKILQNAKKQILLFSGNLSFINLENDLINIFEKLMDKNISIKILCRVDLVGKKT
jgi:hypothetical protein